MTQLCWPLTLSCQVKIWFQNKRSKYKKIMKHGSGGPEGEHLQTAAASGTQCSPAMPPLWDVSMSNNGTPIHTGGYMNSFGHWYPSHHQDSVWPELKWFSWDEWNPFHSDSHSTNQHIYHSERLREHQPNITHRGLPSHLLSIMKTDESQLSFFLSELWDYSKDWSGAMFSWIWNFLNACHFE